MSPMFKNVMLCFLLVTASGCSQSDVGARESRGLDDYITVNKEQTEDAKACGAITYSKEFDEWSKYYLAGDLKKSDQAWARVLVRAKNIGSIRVLLLRSVPRLLFADIPKDSPLKKVEVRDVFKQWIRVAKEKLGEHHRFVGDSYASMASYYESQKIYRNASMYRKKQFQVYKMSFGATNRKAIRALYYSAKNLFLAKDYSVSEATVKQVLKLAEKAKDATGIRESVKLYLSILRKNKRSSEAKGLTDKYKRYL